MAARKDKRLHISSEGNRHVIFVPLRRAPALRSYLQTQGVTSTHPQPVTSETSSVEIQSRYDMIKVQALLDAWLQPAKAEAPSRLPAVAVR